MWRIIHTHETDSTNRLALAGRPYDVFTADIQTAGRGRIGHKWQSVEGESLILSAVVDVAGIAIPEVAAFPLVVGLAVADALARFTAGIRLKWPNDVVCVRKAYSTRHSAPGTSCQGHKLSGILCERHGDSVIAGIGVNVRQTEFPPDIAGRAASLLMLGVDAGVTEIRDAVLASLDCAVTQWRSDGFASLLPRIDAIDFLKDRHVRILRTDDDCEGVCGICGGISSDGSLIVGTERIYAGEAHVEL